MPRKGGKAARKGSKGRRKDGKKYKDLEKGERSGRGQSKSPARGRSKSPKGGRKRSGSRDRRGGGGGEGGMAVPLFLVAVIVGAVGWSQCWFSDCPPPPPGRLQTCPGFDEHGRCCDDDDPSMPNCREIPEYCGECAAGYACQLETATEQQHCLACPLGKYDDDGASPTPCVDCEPGHFAAQGATECSPCGLGLHDADRNAATPCVQCEPGQHSVPGFGATVCQGCPRWAVELQAETVCTSCAQGKELKPVNWALNSAGSWVGSLPPPPNPDVPFNRPHGELANGLHNGDPVLRLECSDCVAGKADLDRNASSPCTPCAPGSYAGAQSTECYLCMEGMTDLDSRADTPCVKCPLDYYSPAGHAGNCLPPEQCSPGTYRLGRGSAICHNCPAGQFDHDSDPETMCRLCSAGQQTAADRLRCDFCAAGFADHDSSPATNCTACAVGRHSWMGSVSCTTCERGEADADSNPATPCVRCGLGTHSEAGAVACTNCTAGSADEDLDPTTVCEACNTGLYAAEGATVCAACNAGWADHDSNPATPCSHCDIGTYAPPAATSCEQCERGETDLDRDPSTPCGTCEPGKFIPDPMSPCEDCAAGLYDHDSDPATECLPCHAGRYSNTSQIRCTICPAGKSDEDVDAATPCTTCDAGEYTHEGAVGLCAGHCCAPGTVDNQLRFADDPNSWLNISDPATPCVHCPAGGYTPQCSTSCGPCHAGTADLDSDPATPCDLCVAGMFSVDPGHCVLCDAGMYDHDSDSATECLPCSAGSVSLRGEMTCHECQPGLADLDSDPATPCDPCEPGHYSGRHETECFACHAGKTDHDYDPAVSWSPGQAFVRNFVGDDADPSTPLSASTGCTECDLGQYMAHQQMGPCKNCPPGYTDQDLGTQHSTPHPRTFVGTHESPAQPLLVLICLVWLLSHVWSASCLLRCSLRVSLFCRCADPDTPCVLCRPNSYAPNWGTRGDCELCQDATRLCRPPCPELETRHCPWGGGHGDISHRCPGEHDRLSCFLSLLPLFRRGGAVLQTRARTRRHT